MIEFKPGITLTRRLQVSNQFSPFWVISSVVKPRFFRYSAVSLDFTPYFATTSAASVPCVVSPPEYTSLRRFFNSSASRRMDSISSSFCWVLRSMSAKSSKTVRLDSSGNRLSIIPLIPATTSEMTGKSTLPSLVFRLSILVSIFRVALAYPSAVRAKSPCASDVACIRY